MTDFKGNPFAEPLEKFVGQHLELDSTLALAYEQRTANLIAVATSPGDLRARISEEQLTNIHDQILDSIGVGDNHGE